MIPNKEKSDPIKVRRTKDNTRKRPNMGNRHDNSYMSGQTFDGLNFIKKIDLEWMSLNYRKERAAKMSPSIRRMILVMFENDY